MGTSSLPGTSTVLHMFDNANVLLRRLVNIIDPVSLTSITYILK